MSASRFRAAFSVLFAAFLALGCGDTWPMHRGRFVNREFGPLDFTSAAWKTADKETRRQMVASLIESRVLDLATRDEVLDLLGPSDCQGNGGTDSCYVVTRGDHKYELEVTFSSRNPSARVVGVGIGGPALTVRAVRVRADTS
jgi:hypothetical protein